METLEIVGHSRCITCGKWAVTAAMRSGAYCSDDCAARYAICPVCGRFFEDRSDATRACSIECSRTFRFTGNRYIMSEETV